MRSEEIGLHVQILLTILDSIVYIHTGGLCDWVMAPWLSPLGIHINSGQAPNLSAFEPGLSIQICESSKIYISRIGIYFHSEHDTSDHLRLVYLSAVLERASLDFWSFSIFFCLCADREAQEERKGNEAAVVSSTTNSGHNCCHPDRGCVQWQIVHRHLQWLDNAWKNDQGFVYEFLPPYPLF